MKKLVCMWECLILGVVLILSSINYSYAHHAMEYIEMESCSTAKKGESVFHLHYDYMVENEDLPMDDHWEITPGISYGITNTLMFDFHTHFAKFGTSHLAADKQAQFTPLGPPPFIEAFAFSLQYGFPQLIPVDIGLVATYELPSGRSKELLDGEEVYEGTLILGKDFGEHRNITINLTFGKDGDEDIKDWAFGIKTPISQDPHGIAAGVEVLGSFEDIEDTYSILPGVYMPLGSENITLKTGIEFGKASESMRSNITLMYRF